MKYLLALETNEINILSRALGGLTIDEGLLVVLKIDAQIKEQNAAAEQEAFAAAIDSMKIVPLADVEKLNGESPPEKETVDGLVARDDQHKGQGRQHKADPSGK